jgi:hypothetical protein
MPKYLSVIVALVSVFAATLSYAAGGFEYAPDADTLALWHMNEGGDKIVDASPNGFDGVVEGKADWGEEEWKKGGDPGRSFVFNGTTVINVGVEEKLIIPDAITVEAWVYPQDLSGWKLICCHWGGAVVGSWHLGVESGIAKFHISTENGVAFAGTQQLSLQEWQHVAGTYDSKTIRLYIDGQEVALTNHGGEFAPGDPNHDVVIGSKASREFQWNGLMDEVRISSVARDPAELSPNLEGPQAVGVNVRTLPALWAKIKSGY